MPETIVQQPKQAAPQAPAVSTPAPETAPKEVTAGDIIKRATTPKPAATGEPQVSDAPKVSVSLDDIKDPVARQILEKKLQEANQGIAKTFGEIGAEKQKYLKEVEALRQQLNAQTNKRYTTRDVQDLLSRPDFVQAATELQQSVAPQGYTQESWSALSPEDKALLNSQRQETDSLKQQLTQMQQSQVISQVDARLRETYPDYDPAQIDSFYQRAASQQMTVDEVREAIYLGQNAKRLISQAYEFGRQDNPIKDKVAGISQMGLNVTPTSGNTVERKPGERSSNVFSAHAHRVLEMLKANPQKR